MQGYIVSFLNPETFEPNQFWTNSGISDTLDQGFLYQDVKEARLQLANLQAQYIDSDLKILPVVVAYNIVDRLPSPPPPANTQPPPPAQPAPAA